MRPRRSSILTVATSLVLTLGLSLGAISLGTIEGPEDVGKWSAPIDVGVIGIHAALLPNGKVLLFEHIYTQRKGNLAKVFDPVTRQVTDVTLPYQRNIFCGGQAFLPNGQLLISGGEVNLEPGGEVGEGTPDSTLFDWTTNTWTETDRMSFARWYPTNTVMGDGSQLVFSGRDERGQERIKKVERYNPGTESYSTLPPSADQDTNGLYPRTLLTTDGKVFLAGPDRNTRMFDPSTNTWAAVDKMNHGRREAGGVVMLPDLHTVLTAGGSSANSAETIDLNEASPQWQYTDSMAYVRNHGNYTLLADGTVLATGGGTDPLPGPPALEAELYDPSTGMWSTMAAQQVDRQYHSTAVLLPDGRVLIAGDDDGLPGEVTTVEIYSPPYLFHGSRPKIKSAPGSIHHNEGFTVRSRQAAQIQRVALIRPTATTHGYNMDQRYVNLDFSRVNGNLAVDAPANGNIAPPGYYMLVIVNGNGVPSIAKFVHLD